MASTQGWVNGLRDSVAGWGDKAVQAIKGGYEGFQYAAQNNGNALTGAIDGAKSALRSGGPDLSLDPSGRLDSGGYDAGKEAIKAQDMKNMQAERALAPGNDYERGPRRMLRTSPVQPHDFTVSPDGTTVPRSAGELAPYKPPVAGTTPPPAGAPPIPPEPAGITPPGGGRPPIPGEPVMAPKPAVGLGATPNQSPEYLKAAQDFKTSKVPSLRGAVDAGVNGFYKAIPGGQYVQKAVNAFPKVGAALGGLTAYDAVDKASQGLTPEQQAGGSALRGAAAEFGDNMLLGYGREAGTALGAGVAGFVQGQGGIRGKVSNALSMAKQGWNDASDAEARVYGNQPAPQAAQPVKAEAPVSGTVGGAQAPADDGKFRRTGDLNTDYRNATAYLLAHGARPDQLSGGMRGEAMAGSHDDAAPFKRVAGKSGVHAMFALGGYGALGRQKDKDANIGLRNASIQATREHTAATDALARAQLGYTMAKDDRNYRTERGDYNSKQFDTEIGSAAQEMVGPQKAGLLGKADPTYESQIKSKAASLGNDIRFTLADRKDGPKEFNQLSDGQKQQLFLAHKFKDNVTSARGGITQTVRDYIGAKRFDSRNLDSYMPASVSPTMLPGGYLVHFKNGNTAQVSTVAGGGFNWTGPNEPVDADMLAMIKNVMQPGK